MRLKQDSQTDRHVVRHKVIFVIFGFKVNVDATGGYEAVMMTSDRDGWFKV